MGLQIDAIYIKYENVRFHDETLFLNINFQLVLVCWMEIKLNLNNYHYRPTVNFN